MWSAKLPCVYILASRPFGTLYVGVTSNLLTRMFDHVNDLFAGFTKRYGIKQLVYYEIHESMDAAIRREKQLKRWRRAWKYRLIEQMNPEWQNLFDAIRGEVLDGPSDAARRERSHSRNRARVPDLRGFAPGPG